MSFSIKLQIVYVTSDGENETFPVAELAELNLADPVKLAVIQKQVRKTTQAILEHRKVYRSWFEYPTQRRDDNLRSLPVDELLARKSYVNMIAKRSKGVSSLNELHIHACREQQAIEYELDCRNNPTLSRNGT
jgi:hypothetical protein